MSRALPIVLALALAAPAVASAEAPEPRKPVDIPRFMGRWYEIVRTPNARQRNCHGAYQVWSQKPDGSFIIDQVCHADSPSGRATHVQTAARILDAPTNAKFEASFFGGLLRKRYWVIDHGDHYEWMIASTADGKFVSILARTPSLAPTMQQALKTRMRNLGFVANVVEDVGM